MPRDWIRKPPKDGVVPLSNTGIDNNVTVAAPGAYALGEFRGDTFYPTFPK